MFSIADAIDDVSFFPVPGTSLAADTPRKSINCACTGPGFSSRSSYSTVRISWRLKQSRNSARLARSWSMNSMSSAGGMVSLISCLCLPVVATDIPDLVPQAFLQRHQALEPVASIQQDDLQVLQAHQGLPYVCTSPFGVEIPEKHETHGFHVFEVRPEQMPVEDVLRGGFLCIRKQVLAEPVECLAVHLDARM
ncbi:hypothetical protein GO497_06840 [Acidovorax citrulli]|nr:hypothetical protein [Paracidovorax citrulli]